MYKMPAKAAAFANSAVAEYECAPCVMAPLVSIIEADAHGVPPAALVAVTRWVRPVPAVQVVVLEPADVVLSPNTQTAQRVAPSLVIERVVCEVVLPVSPSAELSMSYQTALP